MSLTLQVSHKDSATPLLAQLHERLRPVQQRGMMAIIGRQASNVYRAHFRAKNATPNKKGFPRQNFWARLSRATAYDPTHTTSSSATVVVSDPALAMKVHGGTIRPTAGRRMLAIPLRPEAYGHRPSDGTIADLKVVRMGAGLYLGRKEDGAQNSFTKYYRLVPKVTQDADPTALPESTAVMTAVERVAVSYFRRTNGLA